MALDGQTDLAIQVRGELPCPGSGVPGHARQPLNVIRNHLNQMNREELRNSFDRAVIDQIAIADRALAVADAIGQTPPGSLHFRGLFHHLLTTQGDAVVLALGKLFDPPPRKYPTRSIRGFLAVLRDLGPSVHIYRRHEIEQFVAQWSGQTESEVSTLSATALTSAFVSAYEAYLDSGVNGNGDGPAVVLERIRARRDKVVAHNEDWTPSAEERASWKDARHMLEVAKQFAGLVGPAYLDFHHLAQDGTYMLTRQSQMLGTQAERLIQTVNRSLRAGDSG